MNLRKLVNYCLSKENSYIDFPFGEIPICIKCDGHIFAEIYPDPDNYKITLRCDPIIGEFYRKKYEGIVIPGYHVPLRQRKFKNTVLLNGEISEKEIKKLIDLSYENLLVTFKKSKKE